MAVTRKQALDWGTLVIAAMAMIAGGWAAIEAHLARNEAREAIASAKRSADAAEHNNELVMKSQSSFLVPKLERNGETAVVSVRNASPNAAINIRAGYFLYTGPLKSVSDVAIRLKTLALKPVMIALGASEKTDVVGSPIATSETILKTNSTAVLAVPEISFLGIKVGGSINANPQTTKVTVPSQMLAIGVVAYEDSVNTTHTATFCYPVTSGLVDDECAKLNLLELGAKLPEAKATP